MSTDEKTLGLELNKSAIQSNLTYESQNGGQVHSEAESNAKNQVTELGKENNLKEDQTLDKKTDDNNNEKVRHVARLRGLPWKAREKEIKDFLKDEKIIEIQIIFLRDSKASGEALVEFETLDDLQSALLKNRRHIGDRYIELFKATGEDIDIVARRVSKEAFCVPKTQFIIRMRGLPYEATEADIQAFFDQLKIEAIHLIKDDLGRSSGEGFVEFATQEDMVNGMTKDKHEMGRRYIELFQSGSEELIKMLEFAQRMKSFLRKKKKIYKFDNKFQNNDNNSRLQSLSHAYPRSNSHSYPRSHSHSHSHSNSNDNTNMYQQNGHYNRLSFAQQQPNSSCLLMRGLPYSCTETEITKFFQEASVIPVRIHRKADGTEAYVEFHSVNDCSKAMTRDRSFIGPRYIELFRVTYEHMAKAVGLPIPQLKVFASTVHNNPTSTFSIPSNANTIPQNISLISNMPSNFHIRQAPPLYPTNTESTGGPYFNNFASDSTVSFKPFRWFFFFFFFFWWLVG